MHLFIARGRNPPETIGNAPQRTACVGAAEVPPGLLQPVVVQKDTEMLEAAGAKMVWKAAQVVATSATFVSLRALYAAKGCPIVHGVAPTVFIAVTRAWVQLVVEMVKQTA